MRKCEIPYQQIEFLESNGTQYIDTEISIENNFNCEIEVAKNISQLASSTFATVLGTTTIISGLNVFAVCLGLLTNGEYYSQIGEQYIYLRINDTNIHNFKINTKDGTTNVIVDNDVNYSYASSNIDNQSQFLFARNRDNIATQHFCGKIKKCKMYINDILVRDFVPVRVGNVGYMYDKVSKQLFGNIGTGQFILGQDI
jgi:hypothetical protein